MDLEHYMTLTDAAHRAGQISTQWSFRGTEENCDYNELLAMADIHDAEACFVTDEDAFYLVAPNGAIGFLKKYAVFQGFEWKYAIFA